MLINLRNALLAGRRLPYDAEVEYLESTGTQYIDTVVVGGAETQWTIDCAITDTRSQNRFIGQVAPTASYSCRFDFGLLNSGKWFAGVGSADTGGSLGFGDYARHLFELEGAGTFSIDGTTVYSFSNVTWSYPSTNYGGISIFARNFLNNGNQNPLIYMRCFSSKIYQLGIIVRDFIPVRKGTVGYLYDRVSGKLFGNAGTGDFVLGPDVVPVEYIESHGTEYIDTGVYLTGNHSVEIDFQLTAIRQSRKGLFGGLSTSRYGALLSPSNSKLEFGYGSGNIFYQITPDALRHSAKQQKNLLYLDGVLINTFNEATFTSNFSAPLGNFSHTNYAPAQAKYYLSKWYDGDALIRSFRPVRVGTDATSWEGAMMDVLTRRIYRNAGTGAFTYGNDLKYPIPAS